jgi:gamma-glutamylcysteine synthetase
MPSPKPSFYTWSELSQGQKRYYEGRGITAAPYNRWAAMPQAERTVIAQEAKAHGYKDGLQFTAVQAQVKKATGRKIKPDVPPEEAARRLIKGSKRKTIEGRYQYRITARLFDMQQWDHLQWSDFMSP